MLRNILIEDRLVEKSGASAFRGEKIWFRYPGNTHAKCVESLQMSDVKEVTNWYDLLEHLIPDDDTWRQYASELFKD